VNKSNQHSHKISTNSTCRHDDTPTHIITPKIKVEWPAFFVSEDILCFNLHRSRCRSFGLECVSSVWETLWESFLFRSFLLFLAIFFVVFVKNYFIFYFCKSTMKKIIFSVHGSSSFIDIIFHFHSWLFLLFLVAVVVKAKISSRLCERNCDCN